MKSITLIVCHFCISLLLICEECKNPTSFYFESNEFTSYHLDSIRIINPDFYNDSIGNCNMIFLDERYQSVFSCDTSYYFLGDGLENDTFKIWSYSDELLFSGILTSNRELEFLTKLSESRVASNDELSVFEKITETKIYYEFNSVRSALTWEISSFVIISYDKKRDLIKIESTNLCPLK